MVEDEISDEEITTGVLDVLANGSGFVRVAADGQSRDDVYVSPAQIRRCELRAGDEVGGVHAGEDREEDPGPARQVVGKQPDETRQHGRAVERRLARPHGGFGAGGLGFTDVGA